jgi:hypothetical protein
MKGEINKDFYCSIVTEGIACSSCYFSEREECKNNPTIQCPHKHRKHPTPEQFREEYGEEWLDDRAVYVLTGGGWYLVHHSFAKDFYYDIPILCACTPYGRPPDDWKPEA